MRLMSWIFVLLLMPVLLFGQLRTQAEMPDIRDAIARPTAGLLAGFLSSERFSMHHSFSASFLSMGGHGMMLNSYLNTIHYRISDPLTLRVNLGLMSTPYSSFQTQLQDNNSLKFFGGAELMYRAGSNTTITLGVEQMPGYYLYNPYRLTR